MMELIENELQIDEYPQLALLAWNRVVRTISDADAFALYERNWRFVDVDALICHEAELIKRLTAQYGNGVLNV